MDVIKRIQADIEALRAKRQHLPTCTCPTKDDIDAEEHCRCRRNDTDFELHMEIKELENELLECQLCRT